MARLNTQQRQRQMRALRRLIEKDSTDIITKRVAYAMEMAARRVTENVVGWPSLAREADIAAALLKAELKL